MMAGPRLKRPHLVGVHMRSSEPHRPNRHRHSWVPLIVGAVLIAVIIFEWIGFHAL